MCASYDLLFFSNKPQFNHVERECGGVINRIRIQVMGEIKQSHEKKKVR